MTQIFECDHCDYKGPDVWHDDDTGLALCHRCVSTKDSWVGRDVDTSLKEGQIIQQLVGDIDNFLNDRYAEYVDGDDLLDEAWNRIAAEALERAREMFGKVD